MAGMPSSTLPRMMKATIETAMKPAAPPGRLPIALAKLLEKPDWVNAHAMPVAVPMMNRMAPDSAAVSTSIGSTRCHCMRRYTSIPAKNA